MNKVHISDQGSGVFAVAGDLTFAGIDKATLKSFAFLKSASPVILDLSRVTSTDSAGLALIIEWLKDARKHQKELTFKNTPEQLLTLAKLSGLDQTVSLSSQDQQVKSDNP